jgi:hypothetical protein
MRVASLRTDQALTIAKIAATHCDDLNGWVDPHPPESTRAYKNISRPKASDPFLAYHGYKEPHINRITLPPMPEPRVCWLD